MKKRVIIFFFLNIVLVYSSNLMEFDNRRDSIDFLKFLPEYSEENWEVEYFIKGKKYSYTRKIQKIKDKDRLKIISSDESENIVLDKNLMVLTRASKVKNTVSDKLSYDKVFWEYNSNNKKLYIKNYLNGEKIKSEKHKIDKNTIILNPILMQAILLSDSKRKEFNVDAISNAGKYNMDFTLKEFRDLEKIDDRYSLPEKLKKHSKLKEDVYVYRLSLTGLVGKFYPYNFYFVFEKNNNCDLIAYWGGKPSKAEYQIRYDLLYELSKSKLYVKK